MSKKEYFKQRDGSYYTKFTKEELYNKIDPYNITTVLSFLEEMDYPYFSQEWKRCLETGKPKNNCLGRYIALMSLKGYRGYTFKDTGCDFYKAILYKNEIEYKKCGVYCAHWEPACELFNPITKECIYNRYPKALCQDCLYTDEEIKEIKESGNNDFKM
jgi:hypothetical protein